MARFGTICLLTALVIFLVFFSNVALSAAGSGGFFSDISEMLILLTAAIVFVVGVLARETEISNAKGDAQDE